MQKALTPLGLFFVFLSVIASWNVNAIRFSNQYCEFELPPNWKCQLEGAEWVCQSENKDRKKEAIIILAAKIRGQEDSLDQYMSYLKKPKTFSLPGGKTQVSEKKYTKLVTINDHRWVDSLHLASEIPGFYTRYMGTVKEDLGIVVTFSISKNHYFSYQTVFDKVIATLRVFRQKRTSNNKFQLKKKSDDLFRNRDQTWIDTSRPPVDIGQQQKGKAGGKKGAAGNLIWILLIIGIAVALIILKKKKK